MTAAPSIWERIRSGYAAKPQSTAMSTRGTEAVALGKASPPLRLFGDQLNHAAQSARVDRVDIDVIAVVLVVRASVDAPRRPEQLEQVVLRVAPGRVGELVRE